MICCRNPDIVRKCTRNAATTALEDGVARLKRNCTILTIAPPKPCKGVSKRTSLSHLCAVKPCLEDVHLTVKPTLKRVSLRTVFIFIVLATPDLKPQ